MKIPRHIMLGGRRWTIRRDRNKTGGTFDCGTNEIVIGTRCKGSAGTTFVHEVFEALMAMRGFRYKDDTRRYEDLTHFLFSFSHDEWDRGLDSELAQALGFTEDK